MYQTIATNMEELRKNKNDKKEQHNFCIYIEKSEKI